MASFKMWVLCVLYIYHYILTTDRSDKNIISLFIYTIEIVIL